MNRSGRRLLVSVPVVVCACALTFAASPGDTNERDEIGATRLMYAAAFGSLDAVRSLIDGGADVNAAAANGATALMWAAADADKVRVLLDRGAAVNARTADGTTALVAAVNRGNTRSARLLIDRGAEAKDVSTPLLQAAFASANPDVRRMLRDAGIAATHVGQILPALVRVEKIDAPLLRELLDVGLDPNMKAPFATVEFPLLGYAAFAGDLELTEMLMDRGADPNLATGRRATPLMLAAGSDHPGPAIVRRLLDGGADPDARDDTGRSALDWALLQGETEIARLLRRAGTPAGPAVPPLPIAVAHTRPITQALTAAVARMDMIGPAFHNRTKCISCHNQSLPAMARQLAATRGVTVAPDVLAHPTQTTLQMWTQQRNAYMVGRCGGAGFVQSAGYSLTAMAAEGALRTPVIDAVVTCLASRQYPDGSWPAIDVRPPLGGSPIVFTALAIRSLDRYMPDGLRVQTDAQIARARDFLLGVNARDTQDTAMKLLGLVWAQAPAADISTRARDLVALQRADGGWGQVPTMPADAYATGQALYALASGGMSTTDRVYQRGVAYLLRTQLEDGSWFVRSRGFPFQSYFDTGFPHERNQFISAAATSWAVMALAR